jgi:hypothetical protein
MGKETGLESILGQCHIAHTWRKLSTWLQSLWSFQQCLPLHLTSSIRTQHREVALIIVIFTIRKEPQGDDFMKVTQ